MDGIEQRLIELDKLRQRVATLESRNSAEQAAWLEIRQREIQREAMLLQLGAVCRGLVRYIESLPQQLKPHRQNRPPLANWDQ